MITKHNNKSSINGRYSKALNALDAEYAARLELHIIRQDEAKAKRAQPKPVTLPKLDFLKKELPT